MWRASFDILGVFVPATERRPGEEWLLASDVRGDAFRDMETTDNALSVYVLERDNDLDRLVAAYSANRMNVQALDFALFEYGGLAEIGVEAVATPGDLPDAEVRQWHRDSIQLSGSKLLALAQLVQRSAQIERRTAKDVGRLINQAIAKAHIDAGSLKDGIVADLGKATYRPPADPIEV